MCGQQAVGWFPKINDPDIRKDPYCKKCQDKANAEFSIKMNEGRA